MIFSSSSHRRFSPQPSPNVKFDDLFRMVNLLFESESPWHVTGWINWADYSLGVVFGNYERDYQDDDANDETLCGADGRNADDIGDGDETVIIDEFTRAIPSTSMMETMLAVMTMG